MSLETGFSLPCCFISHVRSSLSVFLCAYPSVVSVFLDSPRHHSLILCLGPYALTYPFYIAKLKSHISTSLACLPACPSSSSSSFFLIFFFFFNLAPRFQTLFIISFQCIFSCLSLSLFLSLCLS